MQLNQQLTDILRCPQTGQALNQELQQLVSQDGNFRYPIVDGLPWLLAHPRNSLLDWGAKLNHFQQILLRELSELELDIKAAEQYSRPRLEKLRDAKKRFVVQITELMQPLSKTQVAQVELYDALRDVAPSTQNLLSYEANLYRDWVWGDEENKVSLELVLRLMPDEPGKLCVLGAGAGRLAFDVHQHANTEMTVATDINPLFLLSLNKLLRGQSVELEEFPLQPKNADQVAVSHRIKALQGETANFFPLFADALKPAFKKGCFSTVLTPWLIDIQPQELGIFLKQLNQYLPLGGAWVNFGSLVFHQQRDIHCYSLDEIKSIAGPCGFDLAKVETATIPYLKSPYNAGYRMESVHLWRAVKVQDHEPVVDSQALPDWYLDRDKPIPSAQAWHAQSAQHRFLAESLAQINGARSIKQIAQFMAKKYQVDPEELAEELGRYLLSVPTP